MIQFIQHNTPLATRINDACNSLYIQINSLDINAIEIEPSFREYFMKCHFNRQLFSLKTSANLLHEAILTSKKNYQDIVLMDYGAGLGTLYLLAKMIGLKQVIYNDLMPEFGHAARLIDQALGHEMDEYIVGDSLATCQTLKSKGIVCDIITSRNVLEHIYDLSLFFAQLHQYQPKAIIFNSTTANWQNPATHLQHIMLHRTNRVPITQQKFQLIKDAKPDIGDDEANKLAKALLQYGGNEFDEALKTYLLNKTMPAPKNDYTNCCEANGNWSEHLLPYQTYRDFAPQYRIEFKPGFWDIDYPSVLKRMLGKTMNLITNLLGKKGVWASSFIYIIALPKSN